MMISTDAEEAIDKTQYPFLTKKKKRLNKLGIKGNYLKIIMALYKIIKANITLNEKPKHFYEYTMGKEGFFSRWCGENWITTCKRMKLDPYLHHTHTSTHNGLKT